MGIRHLFRSSLPSVSLNCSPSPAIPCSIHSPGPDLLHKLLSSQAEIRSRTRSSRRIFRSLGSGPSRPRGSIAPSVRSTPRSYLTKTPPPIEYRLLIEFRRLFEGKIYKHRASHQGDYVAMHLFEDLISI